MNLEVGSCQDGEKEIKSGLVIEKLNICAGMVKLVDTLVLGTSGLCPVEVRVLFPAPYKKPLSAVFWFASGRDLIISKIFFCFLTY